MKKCLLLALLCITNLSIYTMNYTVQTPSKEELIEAFNNKTLQDFNTQTNFIDTIANTEDTPCNIAGIIYSNLLPYCEQIFGNKHDPVFFAIRDFLLRIILKDHPNALEYLKTLGLYRAHSPK